MISSLFSLLLISQVNLGSSQFALVEASFQSRLGFLRDSNVDIDKRFAPSEFELRTAEGGEAYYLSKNLLGRQTLKTQIGVAKVAIEKFANSSHLKLNDLESAGVDVEEYLMMGTNYEYESLSQADVILTPLFSYEISVGGKIYKDFATANSLFTDPMKEAYFQPSIRKTPVEGKKRIRSDDESLIVVDLDGLTDLESRVVNDCIQSLFLEKRSLEAELNGMRSRLLELAKSQLISSGQDIWDLKKGARFDDFPPELQARIRSKLAMEMGGWRNVTDEVLSHVVLNGSEWNSVLEIPLMLSETSSNDAKPKGRDILRLRYAFGRF